MHYNTAGSPGEQRPISQVAEEALASGLLPTLWHEVAWAERDDASNEYDPRRVFAKDGIDILTNALTAVGERRLQHPYRSGDRGSLQIDDLMHFSAETDEQAITGMWQLVKDRTDAAQKTWEQIAGMKTGEGTPVMHTQDRAHRQFRARYYDALERQYQWQMRSEGFNLGLHALGLEIQDGSVVQSANTISPEEALSFVKQLPSQNEFRARQLPADEA